jgi:hypothetical protein
VDTPGQTYSCAPFAVETVLVSLKVFNPTRVARTPIWLRAPTMSMLITLR